MNEDLERPVAPDAPAWGEEDMAEIREACACQPLDVPQSLLRKYREQALLLLAGDCRAGWIDGLPLEHKRAFLALALRLADKALETR